ncbi:hypothetical protein SY2F82_35700 [Streptomyces sp. Y2F8-2]|nr:hypothetical protein SY2F82_35700 [Streptomyces sp. Y2F8-2]
MQRAAGLTACQGDDHDGYVVWQIEEDSNCARPPGWPPSNRLNAFRRSRVHSDGPSRLTNINLIVVTPTAPPHQDSAVSTALMSRGADGEQEHAHGFLLRTACRSERDRLMNRVR